MIDDLEDFWGDVRPPAPPQPPAAPQPPPASVEKGFVWFAPIEDAWTPEGPSLPRIRVPVPDSNPMAFDIEIRVEREARIVGIAMYDREHGGKRLYVKEISMIRVRPGDTFTLTLTLSEGEGPMTEFFGLRATFRRIGLL